MVEKVLTDLPIVQKLKKKEREVLQAHEIDNYPEYLENQEGAHKKAEEIWTKGIFKFFFSGSDISEPKKILDAGSGVGRYDRFLAERLKKLGSKNVKIIGIDNYPEMVLFSQQVAEKEGKLDILSFKEGNITDMPFDDNTFNGVIIVFVIYFLSKKEIIKLFDETYRVLKNGGKFYCLHSSPNWLAKKLASISTKHETRYEVTAVENSLTKKETKELINQSLLKNSDYKVRKKWGPLLIKVTGTVTK